MSRSNRELWERKVLIIVDFFQSRAPIQIGRIGPSHHMEYFFFSGNYLRSDTDEKVDLGNNERPNIYYRRAL